MGSPHGRKWRASLIALSREPYARVSAGEARVMTFTRQMTFWVLTFVVGVLVLYVLREILLPFVAGMALAYLLDPLANKVERMGVNRLVATLVIIGTVVLGFVILILLFVPILTAQLGPVIVKLHSYVSRVPTV